MPKHIADHYLNRELSMLEFNRRVLAQAEDARVPLLERLRFLCIVSSNLDEIFEIRVAGLKEQIKLKAAGTDPDGMTAHQVYQAVHVLATSLVARQYQLLNHLWQSPFGLHKHLIEAIENETECAKNKHPASIIAKMNALLEPDVIQALYRASQAGVKIQLIVRGVCALRPGMPGLSENIKVRSIVGRFLEHTRVFYFRNRGKHDVYLSSADWMDRNFFRRIELCFPVLDRRLKKSVLREGLKLYLLDNMEAWQMDARGRYRRKSLLRGKRMCAQEELMKLLNPKTTKVNG